MKTYSTYKINEIKLIKKHDNMYLYLPNVLLLLLANYFRIIDIKIEEKHEKIMYRNINTIACCTLIALKLTMFVNGNVILIVPFHQIKMNIRNNRQKKVHDYEYGK